jgi:hypothetical protein
MDGTLDQLYINEAFRYFDEKAEWPTVERLHRIIVRKGIADVSLGDVLTFFMRHSRVGYSTGHASLRLADLQDMPKAKQLTDEFVQLVRLMVEKFVATPDEDKPTITSAEVGDRLNVDGKELRKLSLLLQGEGVLTEGFTQVTQNSESWSCNVSADAMLFKDIASLGQYLAKRDAKWPQFRSILPQDIPEPKPWAFLLMPFDPKFDWLHAEVVGAGEDANVEVQRADDIFAPGIVIDQIKAAIAQADVVIAVCTDRNANVFYELGIAESKHKPILIAETDDDLPFDVHHFRANLYGGTGPKDSRSTVRLRIAAALRETVRASKRKRDGTS